MYVFTSVFDNSLLALGSCGQETKCVDVLFFFLVVLVKRLRSKVACRIIPEQQV